MDKYNKSKIYKLVNDNNETLYIGSTTVTLAQKIAEMRYNCKKDKSCALYKDIFDKHQGRIKILLIENFACKDINELRAREEEVREYYNNKEHRAEVDKTEIIRKLKDMITLL